MISQVSEEELQRLLPHMTPEERAEVDRLLGPVTVPPPPMSFREFVGMANPRYLWFRHCEIMARVLMRVAAGELNRVMFFLPPRHGKTELVSRLFPAYYLYRFPDRWVGLTSYGAELAYTISAKVHENYERAFNRVGKSASRHWRSHGEGGLWAAGVAGPMVGKGFHLGIIDDPHKSSAEAKSETMRRKIQDWYQGTFYNRQEPNAAIILIQTRWHEQDLAGWLLEQEESEDEQPDRWHIVNFAARAEYSAPVPAAA